MEHMSGDPDQQVSKLSYNNVSSIMFLKPEVYFRTARCLLDVPL